MKHPIAALTLLAGLMVAGHAHAQPNVCQRHPHCRQHGFCSFDQERNMCVAATRRDCRHSMACESRGLCTPMDDRCVASFDADCEQAAVCHQDGRCQSSGGQCVPGYGAEPRQSEPRTTVSVGQLLGGIALSLLGVGGVVGGVALIGNECGTVDRGAGAIACEDNAAWSPLLLLGGAGVLAGGIVLAVKSREREGYTPDIRVGAGNMQLSWRF